MLNSVNGVDVAKHPENKLWIPEMIFGHLRTSTNYKKELVKIGENDYVKRHYEILNNDSERERKFFGLSKSGTTVSDGERDGRKMFLKVDLIFLI